MASENVVKADPQAVAEAVAQATVDVLAGLLEQQETVTWFLAGGTLPPAIYKILVSDYREALDWSKVYFGIGDERCVPFDSPDSSWLAAEQELFWPLGDVIPVDHRLRPECDKDAETAASAYEITLKQLPQTTDGYPSLDLVWLGMGDDGHTLSLFPGHPSFEATDKLVIPVHDSPKPPADRISITLEAMKGCANCFVIAAGAGKAPAIARVQNGDVTLPIGKVTETVEESGGQVSWFLDKPSAAEL